MVGSPLNSHNLTLKFLCSYGGRILPRYPDGKLRYHGGETRVLSVHRSISFSELMVKLGEMCGSGNPVNLRCQLPTEDLDALVSITSDEDLSNLIEEYDRVSAAPLKIRAFLSASKKSTTSSPPSSASSSSSGSSTSPKFPSLPPRPPASGAGRCIRHSAKPPVYPVEKSAGKIARDYTYYTYQYPSRNCGHVYVIHNGSYWQ